MNNKVEERRKAIKKAVVEMRQSLRTLDCDNKENRLNYIQYDLIKITKLADKALGQIRPAARKEAIDHKN